MSVIEEYLQDKVDIGKDYEIALKCWHAFIERRRNEILERFSVGDYSELDDVMAELRVLKSYEDNSYKLIEMGASAKAALDRNGKSER